MRQHFVVTSGLKVALRSGLIVRKKSSSIIWDGNIDHCCSLLNRCRCRSCRSTLTCVLLGYNHCNRFIQILSLEGLFLVSNQVSSTSSSDPGNLNLSFSNILASPYFNARNGICGPASASRRASSGLCRSPSLGSVYRTIRCNSSSAKRL
jgi:hypothetical protein